MATNRERIEWVDGIMVERLGRFLNEESIEKTVLSKVQSHKRNPSFSLCLRDNKLVDVESNQGM